MPLREGQYLICRNVLLLIFGEKALLLLTSASLMFVQIPTPSAQQMLDVSKNNLRGRFHG
jgi:hypothetical protein